MSHTQFGLGIAPSFPNVIGLANRVYPNKFSGFTQSFFGVSANAGNGALPGLAGLLTGVGGIGGVAYVWVPLCGIVAMQVLLWTLLYVRPPPGPPLPRLCRSIVASQS